MDFLEQVVLGEIKRLTKFASRYEDDFVKAVMGSTQQNVALDRKLKEKGAVKKVPPTQEPVPSGTGYKKRYKERLQPVEVAAVL